jgi:hypothetical protein
MAKRRLLVKRCYAIRRALEIAAHSKRQDDLRAAAARLAANPEYQAEIRAVREELDELRAWCPPDRPSNSSARTSECWSSRPQPSTRSASAASPAAWTQTNSWGSTSH